MSESDGPLDKTVDKTGSRTADQTPDPPTDVRVDCLGWKCPRPIIELNRRLGEVEVGQVVELLADDPAAGPDVAAWCRMRNQELLGADPPRFRIRRRH